MPGFFNYGTKNGMWSIINAVKTICRIYTKFLIPITAFVEAHPNLTTEQKTTIMNWLNAASSVCVLLSTNVEVTYEAAP